MPISLTLQVISALLMPCCTVHLQSAFWGSIQCPEMSFNGRQIAGELAGHSWKSPAWDIRSCMDSLQTKFLRVLMSCCLIVVTCLQLTDRSSDCKPWEQLPLQPDDFFPSRLRLSKPLRNCVQQCLMQHIGRCRSTAQEKLASMRYTKHLIKAATAAVIGLVQF